MSMSIPGMFQHRFDTENGELIVNMNGVRYCLIIRDISVTMGESSLPEFTLHAIGDSRCEPEAERTDFTLLENAIDNATKIAKRILEE